MTGPAAQTGVGVRRLRGRCLPASLSIQMHQNKDALCGSAFSAARLARLPHSPAFRAAATKSQANTFTLRARCFVPYLEAQRRAVDFLEEPLSPFISRRVEKDLCFVRKRIKCSCQTTLGWGGFYISSRVKVRLKNLLVFLQDLFSEPFGLNRCYSWVFIQNPGTFFSQFDTQTW